MSVITRFAPSPTGRLHIGSARVALFNFAFARKMSGKFFLRIEDTDTARSTTENIESIFSDLEWLGLDYEDNVVYQSQQRKLYREMADALLKKNLAFEKDGSVFFRHDGAESVVKDAVYGDVLYPQSEPRDICIIRSDGMGTFHFANVVDDIDLGVTHIIRGQDHLVNTPIHNALRQAFGVSLPVYAHLPMILNQEGGKMSKREGGGMVSLQTLQEKGYAPQVVINCLGLLGWTHPDRIEKFDLDDICQVFDIKDIRQNNAKFDQVKLDAFNRKAMRDIVLTSAFSDFIRVHRPQLWDWLCRRWPTGDRDSLISACLGKGCVGRTDSLATAADLWAFLMESDPTPSLSNAQRLLVADAKDVVEKFGSTLLFDLGQVSETKGHKLGDVANALRLALTGSKVTPPLDLIVSALPPEVVQRRLAAAIAGESISA